MDLAPIQQKLDLHIKTHNNRLSLYFFEGFIHVPIRQCFYC